ncbi:MAG: NADPH-dependent F420 reductase [Chloroflexi bacterium]|nr:NADPH-dependent F420 reductase [Chloroflexota bacterium]MDA1297903.1 NADPH-dependent F420 reductase [Chloroflexota bacterium]
MKIGMIGGTGPEGRGLGMQLALAGHDIVIGSRDEGRAIETARELADTCGSEEIAPNFSGADNTGAAAGCEVAFLTVPYSGMITTLHEIGRQLRGKICVNTIAPLEFVSGQARGIAPPTGSAAEEAEREVPEARWVAAFHTVPARGLLRPGSRLNTDALVCSDDADALKTVMGLADQMQGIRGVNAGALENARYLEGATALLININRIYKAHGSIKVVGI